MLSPSKFFLKPPGSVTDAMENEFFVALRLRNGTYKTTKIGRFSEIDEKLVKTLSTQVDKTVNFLDIGVSTGITTVELYKALEKSGFTVNLTCTDLFVDAFLVSLFPGIRSLVDETGYPMRHELFGRSVRPWVRKSDYWIGLAPLRKGFSRWCAKKITKRIASLQHVIPVKLVSRQLQNLGNTEILQDDLFVANEKLYSGFNLVRAANILNHGYFSETVLRKMIKNTGSYIIPTGGYLCVLRTHVDGTNHGTLFCVQQVIGRCSVIMRFGSGSEVEELILDELNKGTWPVAPNSMEKDE